MFSFRPAIREETGLLIGLIGCSGSGKTYSGMRLARGICGDKPFAVIDTEAGRAKHYADLFRFDHGDFKPPFRPGAYADAIKAADDAGYRAIIVDSCSHEWAGEGGILEWQEEELDSMIKRAMEKRSGAKEWELRDSYKMASWIKPKTAHKHMITRLLQVRATLILCFRAEEKIKMEKDENGKMRIIPMGFQPICSKELPYELTVSFLLTPDKPGVPQPIKLQEQHRKLFPDGKQVTEESGRLISEWASGGTKKEEIRKSEDQADKPSQDPPVEPLPKTSKTSKGTFKDAMLREAERIGADKLSTIIGNHGFEYLDDITDRAKQTEIYKIVMAYPAKK